MKNFKILQVKNRGQTLLIAVLILSSVILVALNWGLASVLRIKGSVGISDSIKALYAADSGMECALFNLFKTPPTGTELPIDCKSDCNPRLRNDCLMTNGTIYSVNIVPPPPYTYVISIGSTISSGIHRALEVYY